MISNKLAYLMLTGSALFWSGNFVIGRAFATEIAPITISYLRWSLALVVLLPFTVKSLISQWPIVRSNLPLLIFMGALGVSGFNTFAYLGLQETTATNALIINSFIPMLIILLSRIMPGTPIPKNKLGGILVSTCGVLLLVSQGSLDNLLSFNINRGDLWILAAGFTWAIYSISLRWRPAGLSAPTFLLVTMIIGLLILSPFYWLNLLEEPAFTPSSSNLMVIGYVALFASLGAFLCWNQGVKIAGANTAGQFIHLMPLFGTAMAILFLGERIYWFHMVGAGAIAAGIALSLKKRRGGHF